MKKFSVTPEVRETMQGPEIPRNFQDMEVPSE